MTEEGECCGKCIEVACKVKLSNNTVHVLNVSIPFIFNLSVSPYKLEQLGVNSCPLLVKTKYWNYSEKKCISFLSWTLFGIKFLIFVANGAMVSNSWSKCSEPGFKLSSWVQFAEFHFCHLKEVQKHLRIFEEWELN